MYSLIKFEDELYHILPSKYVKKARGYISAKYGSTYYEAEMMISYHNKLTLENLRDNVINGIPRVYLNKLENSQDNHRLESTYISEEILDNSAVIENSAISVGDLSDETLLTLAENTEAALYSIASAEDLNLQDNLKGTFHQNKMKSSSKHGYAI